jgi:hypothetical protein
MLGIILHFPNLPDRTVVHISKGQKYFFTSKKINNTAINHFQYLLLN